jgi:hypothetical protein
MVANFDHPGSLVGGNFYRATQDVAQGFGDPGRIRHGTDDEDTMLQR